MADPVGGVHFRALTNSKERKLFFYLRKKKKRIIDLLGQRRKLTTVPLALGLLVILKIVIGLQSGLA